jgi:DNA replication and repair protein RecF
MRISKLTLRSFRNIKELSIAPGRGFNLLVGRNAQGKTNVIESIGVVSTGASFRAQDFRDMIMWGQGAAEIIAEAEGSAGADTIAVSMNPEAKTFLKNGKRALPSKSSSVCTVLFAPEEIMLLRGPPSGRRRYFDLLISQVCPAHRALVSKYEKVLRQRNRLLGESDLASAVKRSSLEPWDEQLIEFGARIVDNRRRWSRRINDSIPTHYARIAPGDAAAVFEYAPHCGAELSLDGAGDVAIALSSQLALRRNDELVRGFTLVGPHRDDCIARIGTNAIKSFGSQGQHRSFVLALKLSEMKLFREETGEDPVLLLDDVASELDAGRNRFFFESISQARGQVFITATRESDIDMGARTNATIYDVEEGMAKSRK